MAGDSNLISLPPIRKGNEEKEKKIPQVYYSNMYNSYRYIVPQNGVFKDMDLIL